MFHLATVQQGGELDWTGVYRDGLGQQTAASLYFQTNLASHLCGCVRSRLSGAAEALGGCNRWHRKRCLASPHLPTCVRILLDPDLRGSLRAFLVIYEVLGSISAKTFLGDLVCDMHGAFDCGLAGQLYGRLMVLQFAALKARDRIEAEVMRASLLKSINKHANGPWLRPRNECYGSIERKDPRCLEVFRGGFIQVTWRRLVASGYPHVRGWKCAGARLGRARRMRLRARWSP